MRIKDAYKKPILSSCPALMFLALIMATSCTHSQISGKLDDSGASIISSGFHLTSTAFKNRDTIPPVFTCDSSDISPPLEWKKPPGEVKSYALIADDPDAPMGVWVHWVVFNIPGAYTSLQAHFPIDSVTNSGIRQGITSFGTMGYRGPCPPDGVHHYYFKLFALDTILNLPCAATGEKKLIEAMKGHIITEAGLMGLYKRKLKNIK